MRGLACSAIPSPLKPQETSCGHTRPPDPLRPSAASYTVPELSRRRGRLVGQSCFNPRTPRLGPTSATLRRRCGPGAYLDYSVMVASFSGGTKTALETVAALISRQEDRSSARSDSGSPSATCPARACWTRTEQSGCLSPYAATRARKHWATRPCGHVAAEGQVQSGGRAQPAERHR